jgi:hypothetical protein
MNAYSAMQRPILWFEILSFVYGAFLMGLAWHTGNYDSRSASRQSKLACCYVDR